VSPDPIPLGLDPAVVQEWADLFNRDPVARMIAEIAQRTGRPYRVVEAEFEINDLAAEAGLQALKVAENHRRCGQCGTRPDEFEDERGRPVDNPMWTLETWTCEWCAAIAEEAEDVPEKRRPFLRNVTVPNKPSAPGRQSHVIARNTNQAIRSSSRITEIPLTGPSRRSPRRVSSPSM
jgi:hypothetical protein